MKILLKTCMITGLLCSPVLMANGQISNNDSIHVRIDDQMIVNMSVYTYQDLSEAVENDLTGLRTVLQNEQENLANGSWLITYDPGKALSIEPGEPGDLILLDNGVQVVYHFTNQCIINSEKYSLQIRFSNPEDLYAADMINKLQLVIENTDAIQGRMAFTYHYTYQGSELVHNEERDEFHGQLDAISLKGGVGANLIKNRPVVDLSAEVGLMFTKKGIWKNQFYVSYNQLYVWNEESKIQLNGFANLGYRYNLSNSMDSPNWLGIEFGYLVRRNGDLLDKNTFRLGFNWDLGKYISVSPQLYLSGNSTYPALRIGFGM